MKTGFIVLGAILAVACGGSQKKNGGVMTQEERLNQQLALAEEQRAEQDEQLSNYEMAQTTEEEAAEFDKEGANHELKRASLNAVDCPNTFEKSQLKDYSPGTATISMIFENNGMVKNVTVAAPYEGTAVGDCVKRAYSTVHVEPFRGAEVPMNWEIELEAPKAPEAK